jgi:hypothetical protein
MLDDRLDGALAGDRISGTSFRVVSALKGGGKQRLSASTSSGRGETAASMEMNESLQRRCRKRKTG